MLMKLKGISTCFTYKEVLSKKRDFKGELDIMLDDYRCILGEMEFKKLIDSLPKENKEFYAIKEAIEFSQSE